MRLGSVFVFFLLSVKVNLIFAQWSDVNLGVNSAVHAFYVDSASGLLFVGGQFNYAGGQNINNIGTWDGTQWSSFGSNAEMKNFGPSFVAAIVNFNGSIIIGGRFDTIGTTVVNNISKWNGLSWEPLGNGFDDIVEGLIVYDNELYACGGFSRSGLDTVRCLAKWTGSNWVRISDLIGQVYSMTIYDGKLVVAGSFYYTSNPNIFYIMGWDGSVEDTTLAGFNNTVFSIRNYADTLYAVGSFTAFSLNPSNYISLFYDQAWHSIGSPTGGSNWVQDVSFLNNSVYYCGYFTNPPDICRYNGLGFDSVGDVLGYVQHLVVYNDNLYAGGLFTLMNGVSVSNIARYHDIGNGIQDLSISGKETLRIYPNPSDDGKFKVLYPDKMNNSEYSLEIYSINGVKINESSGILNNDFFSFELPNKSMMYFTKIIIDNSRIYTNKLITIGH